MGIVSVRDFFLDYVHLVSSAFMHASFKFRSFSHCQMFVFWLIFQGIISQLFSFSGLFMHEPPRSSNRRRRTVRNEHYALRRSGAKTIDFTDIDQYVCIFHFQM